MRNLLRVVNAHDRGVVTSLGVADHLAKINNDVHLTIAEKTVGPSCIVVWRNRKEGVHKGGGGHQFYTGTARDAISPSLPMIGNGIDLEALFDLLVPRYIKMSEEMRAGQPVKELDNGDLNSQLARLPDKPDENLR